MIKDYVLVEILIDTFNKVFFSIKTQIHSIKRVFKVLGLYMEHFATFQYLTHNGEKLSVYVKCERLCNNKLHPYMQYYDTITIDQKQLENVKSFKYLGSLLTDDGRCTCEIKSRIVMAKTVLTRRRIFLPTNWN